MNDSKWFVIPNQKPNCRMRLFCFPYAGGGASIFYKWADMLIPELELILIQPPGRGARINEKLYSNLNSLGSDLVHAMAMFMDKPFAFFGHSLGGLMAFETMRQMRNAQLPIPCHFFASAIRSPDRATNQHNLATCNDDELVAGLRAMNGTPPEILDNAELMEILLPVIRADLMMAMSYLHPYSFTPYFCSCSVLTGIDDTRVSPNCSGWGHFFSRSTAYHQLPGDHFFINTQRAQIVDIVNDALSINMQSCYTKSNNHVVSFA